MLDFCFPLRSQIKPQGTAAVLQTHSTVRKGWTTGTRTIIKVVNCYAAIAFPGSFLLITLDHVIKPNSVRAAVRIFAQLHLTENENVGKERTKHR